MSPLPPLLPLVIRLGGPGKLRAYFLRLENALPSRAAFELGGLAARQEARKHACSFVDPETERQVGPCDLCGKPNRGARSLSNVARRDFVISDR